MEKVLYVFAPSPLLRGSNFTNSTESFLEQRALFSGTLNVRLFVVDPTLTLFTFFLDLTGFFPIAFSTGNIVPYGMAYDSRGVV